MANRYDDAVKAVCALDLSGLCNWLGVKVASPTTPLRLAERQFNRPVSKRREAIRRRSIWRRPDFEVINFTSCAYMKNKRLPADHSN